MASIPKAFKVKGRTYRVERVPKSRIKYARGAFYGDERVIEIASGANGFVRCAYTEDEQFETLWHELLHVVLSDMGHPLNNNEQFVEAVSSRLVALIRGARF